MKRQELTPVAYCLELALFFLHANMVYLYLPSQWPRWPPISDNPIVVTSAVILSLSGLGILLAAVFKLGLGPTMGIDKNALKTGGLYAYSRNPQLIGYLFIQLAFLILYPVWGAVIWVLVYSVIAGLMVFTEEQFLQVKYGESFKKYCQKVPRTLSLGSFQKMKS